MRTPKAIPGQANLHQPATRTLRNLCRDPVVLSRHAPGGAFGDMSDNQIMASHEYYESINYNVDYAIDGSLNRDLVSGTSYKRWLVYPVAATEDVMFKFSTPVNVKAVEIYACHDAYGASAITVKYWNGSSWTEALPTTTVEHLYTYTIVPLMVTSVGWQIIFTPRTTQLELRQIRLWG